MNGTPRLRSAYPSTPGSGQTIPEPPKVANKSTSSRNALPNLPRSPGAPKLSNSPLIPTNLIDAPSQRGYISAVYGILLVWRLYDWWRLLEEDSHSILLFIKWSCIDLGFLFGVPLLQVPWLEWSETTSLCAYIFHAVLNGMLMFRIPFPIEGLLLYMSKTLFDRELSISENSVRPANLLHNSSLIMGKQIINILPEGSATMNPDSLPFCVGSGKPVVHIPIRFNQTRPKSIELLRIDFDTNINETITLSQKERKRLTYDGKDHKISTLSYQVRKPGLYRLYKIIDESNLEVQRRMSDTLVVRCPTGIIKSRESNKCLGDLSDLNMEIEGTPPLKVVYSRTTNSVRSVHHFQSIQPENFVSPLLGTAAALTPLLTGEQDVSWAGTYRITVPLNESMSPGGLWLYSIDEIHDATGNIANFSTGRDDGEHEYPKGNHLEQAFTVHERPVAQLAGCDTRNPLRVAKGKAVELPVQYTSQGRKLGVMSHKLTWKFSPLDSLTVSGDHGEEISVGTYDAKHAHDAPRITEPGLYTLSSIESKFCDGKVKEPASCLLLNPPEPQLSVISENINDKCAGNSIGLLVSLDLIGTPPFVIRYDVVSKNSFETESIKISGLRHQLELKPREAGHFTYQFTSISDAVYKSYTLESKGLILEQDVKPPASAYLRRPATPIDGCIEESVDMLVELAGEQPFTLEYELVHNGKRKKEKVANIDKDLLNIRTDALNSGGEYSLALASVQDKAGCKIFLNDEIKFTVRRQRPKVSFGHLDGKYKTVGIEGRQIELPLRLTGRSPWTVKFQHIDDSSKRNTFQKKFQSTNDALMVNQWGTYEILEVMDDQCPGTVDPTTAKFEVDWLPRPRIKPADTAVLIPDGNKYIKREICEGDIDAVEVKLLGASPFHVKYQVRHIPGHGHATISNKDFEAALGLATISMETVKSGKYQYVFSDLSDGIYEHDPAKFTPLVIEQNVNPKPAADFLKPGQSYKYCKEDIAGDEVVPIQLRGTPPFHLELDIKHQSSVRPETIKIANIESNHYDFRIPHRVLSLGIHHVSVRKVRDSRGCQHKVDISAPHVQVQVYDVPKIYPSEARKDYCVGERISYTVSGSAPFEIFYTFEGVQRKAKSPSTTFKRIAEKPGQFIITAVSDKASECKAAAEINKTIHPMPSVRVSKGRQLEVDIHEGGEAAILFEFEGTPPFEFTYTRSTNTKRGQKSQVLETRHEVSYEFSKTIHSSQEGTYEVVAIKDKYCAFSSQKAEKVSNQKLLQF